MTSFDNPSALGCAIGYQKEDERNQRPTMYVERVKMLGIYFDMSHRDSSWVLIHTLLPLDMVHSVTSF